MPTKNSDTEISTASPCVRRRAKIVCTIGPSCNSEAALRDLMRLGMDVARLNFSHGTHEEHGRIIERLRKAAAAEGRTICILQDLQGPKIRTGRLRDRRAVMLAPGSRVTITPKNILGTAAVISTSFTSLADEVQRESRILLSDGLIELKVVAIHGRDVECEVVNGGDLREHQGINLPGTAVHVPALTEKDKKDLEFGIARGVDMVALSFVRTADDVLEAKHLIGHRSDDLPVIAKLEKPQAIEHLDEILAAADGVMVARGDLGVELPPEQVPVIQKHVIRRAGEARKPVITATQMLESMIEHPRPTRAEASDVANAIFDGTDAAMLSGETASGQYPREAVIMMSRIIVEAEAHMRDVEQVRRRRDHQPLTISETVCESVAHAADELDMQAIAVYTETGTTARLVSKYRPKAPVYAFAHHDAVCNRLNLYWGVHPLGCQRARSVEEMLHHAEESLTGHGLLAAGQIMGIISGTRGASGSTNLMRLHVVGESDRGPRDARFSRRGVADRPERRNQKRRT